MADLLYFRFIHLNKKLIKEKVTGKMGVYVIGTGAGSSDYIPAYIGRSIGNLADEITQQGWNVEQGRANKTSGEPIFPMVAYQYTRNVTETFRLECELVHNYKRLVWRKKGGNQNHPDAPSENEFKMNDEKYQELKCHKIPTGKDKCELQE